MRILKLFLAICGVGLVYAVMCASPAWAVVDLKVDSIAVKPTEPAFNQPVEITVKVSNNGDEAIFSNNGLTESALNINFTDFDRTDLSIPTVSTAAPFKPGAVLTYTIKGSFYSKGTKNVGFGVDYYNNVDEWKEDNNYLYIKVEVVEQNDLNVEKIEISPAKPAASQDVVITVSVKNDGYASLKSMIGINTYSYSIEDFTETEKTEPAVSSDNRIESGKYLYFYFHGRFSSPGNKKVSFAIDTNNNLPEKNEDNNSLDKTLSIASPSALDIGVTSIALDKTEPLLGDTVKITVTVTNTGSVSLISDAGLRYESDTSVYPIIDKEVKYSFEDFKVTGFSASDYPSAASPLDPGETMTYTYTGSFFNNPGEHSYSFQVNTNERLKDFNMANNTLSGSVFLYDDATARDDFEISDYRTDAVSSTSVRISWQTTKKAKSRASYKQSGFTGWVDTAESDDYLHSRTLTGLKRGFKYDYQITAAYNTVSREVKNLAFSTPAVDYFNITGGPRLAAGAGTAEINWQTAMLANGYVYYRKTGTSAYTNAGSKDYTIDHSVKISGLSDGDYEYYVSSTNQPGIAAVSTPIRFTIGTAAATAGQADETNNPTGESVQPAESAAGKTITNTTMYNRLKGKIILTVEQNGEAYYIDPASQIRHYLGRPADAFAVMREQGTGITNANLAKIPIGLASLSGVDTDGDGLSDMFEDAIGTDKNKADTDGDSHDDKTEVAGGYNPRGAGMAGADSAFSAKQAGKIFLQIENNGEAWYVNPADNKRYFLGRPSDAFAIMRTLGLGISNSDFTSL